MPVFRITLDNGTAVTVDAVDESSAVQAALGAAPPRDLSIAEGTLRNVAQGATFNLGDELAGLTSKVTGGDYGSARQAYQAELDRYNAQYPGAGLAGQLSGGVLQGIGTGAALGGTKVGKAALDVYNRAGILKKGTLLAGQGAAYGAAGGAGAADPGSRGEGAAMGGLFGAALGVGIPAAAGAVGSVLNAGKNLYTRVAHPEVWRNRALATAALSDQTPEAVLRSRLRQAGGLGTIAEAGGRNLQTIADVTSEMPGPTAGIAEKTIKTRLKPLKVQKRLETDLAISLGVGDFDTADAVKTLHQNMRGLGPQYEQVVNSTRVSLDTPIIGETPAGGRAESSLKKLLTGPTMRSALAAAKSIVADDEAIGRAHPAVADELSSIEISDAGMKLGTEPTAVSLRAWDYVKRGLDSIVKGGIQPNGKLSSEAERAITMKHQLLQALDDAAPAYKEVRSRYADQKAGETALELGRAFMRQDEFELPAVKAAMSPAEFSYFKLGAARAMRDKILMAATPNTAMKQLERGPMAAKLRTVFGDERSYQQFRRALTREATFAVAPQRFGANSATSRREFLKKQGPPTDPAILSDLLRGAHRWLFADIGRQLMKTGYELTPESAAQMAPLFSTDPAVQQTLLKDIFAEAAKLSTQRGANPYASGLLGAGIGQSSGLLPR